MEAEGGDPRLLCGDSVTDAGEKMQAPQQPGNLVHEPRWENWSISTALVVGHFSEVKCVWLRRVISGCVQETSIMGD